MSLQDELLNDPESLGYAPHIAIGADGCIAELINAPRYPTIGKLPISSLQAWMMAESVQDESGRSIWQAMQDAAAGTGPEKRAAQEALDIMGSRFDSVDLALPRPAALLEGYSLAGLISADQKAAVIAMATTMKSRADVLFGGSVSDVDIARALRG